MATTAENIILFQKQTQAGSTNPLPYDRLMIYYRKQKAYRKELQLINKGLKVFGEQFKKWEKQLLAAARSQRRVTQLSQQLNKTVGLTDKKGRLQWLPEPLARWMKRKQTVEEKIKRDKS